MTTKQFKIFTKISGGATGYHSSYMKAGTGAFPEELLFETRKAAETFIAKCKKNRSPYSTFSQRYQIEEV